MIPRRLIGYSKSQDFNLGYGAYDINLLWYGLNVYYDMSKHTSASLV